MTEKMCTGWRDKEEEVESDDGRSFDVFPAKVRSDTTLKYLR